MNELIANLAEKLGVTPKALIITVIYLKGYYDKFVGQGTAALTGWMIAAVLFLGFIIACAVVRRQDQ